jgi:dolichol-phosphate mannosyltransferase
MKSNDTKTERNPEPLISVVLPVYNESAVLPRLVDALAQSLANLNLKYEILFVNDGSTDSSGKRLDRIAETNSSVKVLHLSRNFGHQSAVHAGLMHTSGDVVIVMDSDMQDEPSCLADFVEHWRMGFDVVYAVRTNRKENFIKRLLFHAFYRVLNSVSTTTIPNDAGIFSLMDRKVVHNIVQLAESDRYLPGLRQWVGFRQIGIPVERNERHDDKPRVSTYGLFQLAKTALFSFSRVPLSSFYAIASVSVLVCVGCISFTLYHKIFTGLAIPGWASMTIIGSFFGAINALGIGVLGEYVVRIYDQVRARPQFIVARTVNFQSHHITESDEQEILQEIKSLSASLEDESSSRKTPGIPSQAIMPMIVDANLHVGQSLRD